MNTENSKMKLNKSLMSIGIGEIEGTDQSRKIDKLIKQHINKLLIKIGINHWI